ncbi:MAG: thiamine diphosphokinase [Flavobacteriaceae bacterium]|nr:thiamine diphosphokinase [Flavobacteriaceae bacterium]
MKAFLLINGQCPQTFPQMEKYDVVCATDGAYRYLQKKNIVPDWISGDFDSLEEQPKGVKVIPTPNQNYTDFEKALAILVEKGCKSVDVYGASGKEQDHFLGNISAVLSWKEKIKITFYDDYGYYFIAPKNTVLNEVLGKTISLIPLPFAKKITTQGLQYPLNEEDLSFGKRIGTRNKAVSNQVKIYYSEGELLLFVNEP